MVPPQAFWQGIEEFNRQEFYACHDTLEALWMESGEPDRNFYQGILQIAVACYHLGNQNLRGTVILLGEGTKRLRDYQPTFAEIDVTQLVNDSLDLLKILQQKDLGAIAPSQEGENDPLVDRLPKIVKIDS